MARINYEQLEDIHFTVKTAYMTGGFEESRIEWKKAVSERDLIELKDMRIIPVILSILDCLYNPDDKGKFGKIGEVEERLIQWSERRKFCYINELHARKSGRSDIGKRTEIKTGAGDWLYSLRYNDRESIIKEYYNKTTEILWTTEYFRIRCSWGELFEYLEQYNGKGLNTWFKSNTKHDIMTDKTVVMMQEFKTSKKKIAYLQECPYCE